VNGVKDCVPPITAARACKAVRTTLCTAAAPVSEQPAVCAWNRSAQERGDFAPNRSVIVLWPDAARGAILGDFLEEVLCALKRKKAAGGEFVDIEAAPNPFHICDSVAQCESKFLDRRGAASGCGSRCIEIVLKFGVWCAPNRTCQSPAHRGLGR